jgi:CheY-like chemotaxis protein
MSKKLLLVEDDKAQQLVWKQVFRFLGDFEVIIAKDGFEGLKKLTESPDVIVLDISMPGMNGIAFLNEFYNNKKYKKFTRIPIAVLTVWIDDEEVATAMKQFKHVKFLNKEDDRKKVVEKVKQIIVEWV